MDKIWPQTRAKEQDNMMANPRVAFKVGVVRQEGARNGRGILDSRTLPTSPPTSTVPEPLVMVLSVSQQGVDHVHPKF